MEPGCLLKPTERWLVSSHRHGAQKGRVDTSLGFSVHGPERFEVMKEWTWPGLAITSYRVQKHHYHLSRLFPGSFAGLGL